MTGQAYQRNFGEIVSPPNPPVATPYRDDLANQWDPNAAHTNPMTSVSAPGGHNYSEEAAGGLTGATMNMTEANVGNNGAATIGNNTSSYYPQQGYGQQHAYREDQYLQPSPMSGNAVSSSQDPYAYQHQLLPQPSPEPHLYQDLYNRSSSRLDSSSRSSLTPLGAGAVAPSISRPAQTYGIYSDFPRNRNSQNLDAFSGFDPNSIADDGDDGLEYKPQRGSMLSLGHHSDQSNHAGGPVAAKGVMGALGGLVGRSSGGKSSTTQYNPVVNPQTFDLGPQEEKSDWLKRQTMGKKKWNWIVGAIVVIVILGAIGGGVAAALLEKKNASTSSSSSSSSTSSSPTSSPSGDTQKNGDLNKNSPEIIALMNNKNLHKVFPGIDYTPINTQYPDCLTNPPSPNNVTRDLAVLSQLTNTIRLYGTDCNQTEMVMHSISNLGLNGTMKVWLGVWQDTNTTTNARQLAQMYKILDTYGQSPFVGIIVGNEILFRKDMTEAQLVTLLGTVRSNLTAAGINLPVTTSDLGDNWTANLASAADYVMANVHPFFSGVNAVDAASWTYSFFHDNDASFKTDSSKLIISETGWPSAGGMDCGSATTCTNGSVAGITEMNTFLNDWVCQSIANDSNYFWFEAFDEPWKIEFDTATENWEDKWGVMDVNRNLKDGLTIPDCSGKTVDGMKVS